MDENEKNQNQDVTPEKNIKEDQNQSSGEISKNAEANKIVDNKVNDRDMEVHVKHKEHKEFNYKVFLYEFFIIFFAVSVSFFVENIRERYIEHHKEKEYVKSLINDVKLDTAQLTSSIYFTGKQFDGIDTLLKELENPNSKRITNYLYHYSFHYINGVNLFNHTDRTITQLKNAGGLRLIRSKAASDSIVDYYGSVQNIELNGDYLIKFFCDLTKQEKELLDYKVMRNKNNYNLLKDSNLKLLSRDSKRIDLYYNEALYYTNMLDSYRNKLVKLKKIASQLLETLNKEYK